MNSSPKLKALERPAPPPPPPRRALRSPGGLSGFSGGKRSTGSLGQERGGHRGVVLSLESEKFDLLQGEAVNVAVRRRSAVIGLLQGETRRHRHPRVARWSGSWPAPRVQPRENRQGGAQGWREQGPRWADERPFGRHRGLSVGADHTGRAISHDHDLTRPSIDPRPGWPRGWRATSP